MKKCFLKLLCLLTAAVLMAVSLTCALAEMREDADNFFVNTDQKYEKLIDRMEKSSHNNSFTGSVLIATEDEIILYGGPKAVTRDGRPADMHTTYDIGSCSKLFTAAAVFQLIEAGRLSLDDPIIRFFPEYETGRDITVYQLLHMQSGIADYVNDPPGFWVNVDERDLDEFMVRSFRDEVPEEEFFRNLYAAPLLFDPGSEMAYSNTNYVLLAVIIEKISGMSLCDYLKENIFDPCGMEHTSSMVAGDETSVPRVFGDLLAAGIVDENGYTMAPVSERGAGGIHTCMADLWAFDKALFSGRLVSAGSLEEIMNFDMDYGCGLMPVSKNACGHSGRNGTYTTQNVIIESEQYGRVYFLASTATDAGTYGLGLILNTALVQLGGF